MKEERSNCFVLLLENLIQKSRGGIFFRQVCLWLFYYTLFSTLKLVMIFY